MQISGSLVSTARGSGNSFKTLRFFFFFNETFVSALNSIFVIHSSEWRAMEKD